MSEIGLVPFARVALEVCEQVIGPYSHKFSPQRFTQPQLLAVLCLMRYEDWTFRGAEVRLSEHGELRATLRLKQVPDHTTLYRFFERLDERIIQSALTEIIRRMGGRRRRRRRIIAVDATGLSPGAISTFFVRRTQHHGGAALPWRYWLKWLLCVDVDNQLVLAQQARQGPTNDCAHLPEVVDEAARHGPLARVLADAEFDSERNHRHVRLQHGAQSVIPAKRGKRTWKIQGWRKQMRERFPQNLYSRRSLIESVISRIKRRLSSRAPGRSPRMQCKQALLLGLAYNLYRLWRPQECCLSNPHLSPINA